MQESSQSSRYTRRPPVADRSRKNASFQSSFRFGTVAVHFEDVAGANCRGPWLTAPVALSVASLSIAPAIGGCSPIAGARNGQPLVNIMAPVWTSAASRRTRSRYRSTSRGSLSAALPSAIQASRLPGPRWCRGGPSELNRL
jgi:hypothetical protein